MAPANLQNPTKPPPNKCAGCAVTGTIFSALGGAQLFGLYQAEFLTRIRGKGGAHLLARFFFVPRGCAVIWPLRTRWTLRTYLGGVYNHPECR